MLNFGVSKPRVKGVGPRPPTIRTCPESDLFMENLDISCGLEIWLHQIIQPAPPSPWSDLKAFHGELRDTLCGIQIWLHKYFPLQQNLTFSKIGILERQLILGNKTSSKHVYYVTEVVYHTTKGVLRNFTNLVVNIYIWGILSYSECWSNVLESSTMCLGASKGNFWPEEEFGLI